MLKIKNSNSKVILFLLSVLALFPADSFGSWVLLPESLHQQFHTFALFIDQQSVLLGRDGRRGWGSVAANLALYGSEDSDSRPQIVLSASANTGFGIKKHFEALLTQTIDARLGLAYNWASSAELRWSAGWQHQSGHISDDVPNPDLIGSNLGNELIYLRVIRDIENQWRVGGTLKPFLGSEPRMQRFAADQFVEWFPWGTQENPKKLTPYLALALEQYGLKKIEWSGTVQVGAYVGNHLKPVHQSNARVMIGYYDGVDPRLKYAQYKGIRSNFAFFGLGFDI